jgi:CheY-like chemotaxis protein
MMNGNISVESCPGRGSTFHVILTLGLPDASSNAAGETNHLGGVRVLIADDHEGFTEVTAALLRGWGAHVEAVNAIDPRTASCEDTTANHDVALLDAGLPNAGCLCSRMRKRGTPVIVLTGPDLPILPDAAARLMKPVSRCELREAIFAALGRRSPGAAAESALGALSERVAATDARNPALRILVAEDNPVNQRVIVGLLTKRGYDVTTAGNGEVAFRLFREGRYDLVLMDVQMPVMDGFESAGEIRSFESRTARGRTPIIALTAHAMEGYRSICLEAGMDGYLAKPVNSSRLFEAIDEFAGRKGNPEADQLRIP